MTPSIMDTRGFVGSMEPFGSFDGPGLRYVVFLRGCPLRCIYCHNPETWAPNGPSRNMSVGEIIDDMRPLSDYYSASGGGVTVSGGEPLLQPIFARDIATAVKTGFGLNTALDTSGTWSADDTVDETETSIPDDVKALIDTVDIILLDIKAIDPDLHRRITGLGNAQTMKVLEYSKGAGKRLVLRHVMVEGLTDTESELSSLKRLADDAGAEIELLPYHSMAKGKWKALGLGYPLPDMPDYPQDKLGDKA